MTTSRTCPDCQVPLNRIDVLDRYAGHSSERGLVFVAEGDTPKISAWKGNVSNKKGRVHGYLCNECQRVLFYADLD